MPNVAIICEFNPFHNGHAAVLEHARKLAGTDGKIFCIMSGNFVERGDIAVLDKWTRAELALNCGADIVVEIPSVFAMQSAEYFAEAGVSIANAIGSIDFLLFGSESGDIDALSEFACNAEGLKGNLRGNASYAKALEATNGERLLSNDILGVEYIKALKKTGSKIKPVAMKRVGKSLETDEGASSCSALAIRNMLKEGNFAGIQNMMPKNAFEILENKINSVGVPDVLRLETYIIGKLREMGPSGIAELCGVNEGLENKIYKEALSGADFSQIVENCTSKRYTRSRIRRILLSVLTGARSNLLKNGVFVPYLRVLGVRSSEKALLASIGVSKNVPVIVGNFPADYQDRDDISAEGKKIIRNEILATDLYALAFSEENARKGGKEFSQPLVIIH